jgi:hypothetical protein
MQVSGHIRCPCRIVILLAGIACGCRTSQDPLAGFPTVVLWAWERPEHLTWIDPRRVGVAVLARTISWRDGIVTPHPRHQPAELPNATPVIAVIRLESQSLPLPDPAAIATQILAVSALPRIRAIQIDFDARQSEREWYAALLQTLHRRLPPNVALTITALASWCLGDPRSDPWIKNLPIADAVPMLFRMGHGEPAGITDFSTPICRSSVGISLDEAPLSLPHNRRVFIFNPHPWTPESYRAAMELMRRLR